MERSLQAFLNPVQVENEKIVISKRFMEDGKPVEWEIRPIATDENDRLLKKHSKINKKGIQSFDRAAYLNELVASAVVYPDLKNAELQNAYGVRGEVSLLTKMLLIGEFATLNEAVQSLSGLDLEENDELEEVKN